MSYDAEEVLDVLKALDRRIDSLDRAIQATDRAVVDLAAGRNPANLPEVTVNSDTWWTCACGSRLGMYDPKAEVMHVRYKDHFQRVHLPDGCGGWIEQDCRSCGRVVRLEANP
jgi:hypothetical protein